MSGLDGSSIKQKSQCAAGLPGRSHLPECRSEACVERWVHDIFHLFIIVPVAQPDRVSDSDSEGLGFESLRVRHEKTTVLIETVVFSAKSTLTGGINRLRR